MAAKSLSVLVQDSNIIENLILELDLHNQFDTPCEIPMRKISHKILSKFFTSSMINSSYKM